MLQRLIEKYLVDVQKINEERVAQRKEDGIADEGYEDEINMVAYKVLEKFFNLVRVV